MLLFLDHDGGRGVVPQYHDVVTCWESHCQNICVSKPPLKPDLKYLDSPGGGEWLI